MPSYLGGERCNDDCSGTEVSSNAGRCMSCGTTLVDKTEITQKRMWNQVRAPSSMYTMNLAALNVAGSSTNRPGKPVRAKDIRAVAGQLDALVPDQCASGGRLAGRQRRGCEAQLIRPVFSQKEGGQFAHAINTGNTSLRQQDENV